MTDRERLIVDKLDLKHLNVEDGLFSLITESAIEVVSDNERLSASNLIYMMLNGDEPVNYVQKLESDDYQILIEGGPADYYLFYTDGASAKITMGRDIANGEQFVVAAPGGTAKAIVLHDEADYMLFASVNTPAWTPTRVEIGGDDAFVQKFAGSSDWATPEKIRALTGPNFGTIVGGRTDELNLTIDDAGQIIFQGMQLAPGQLEKEFKRFAAAQPGRSATLSIIQNAPSEVVVLVKNLAENIQVRLEQIPSD